MVSNIDLGDAKDIHPKTKREVGRRMAAIALNQTYGKHKTAFTAPVYERYTVEAASLWSSRTICRASYWLAPTANGTWPKPRC